jgi:hypothetical protein
MGLVRLALSSHVTWKSLQPLMCRRSLRIRGSLKDESNNVEVIILL